MKMNSDGKWWILTALLTLPVLTLTISAQQTNSLVVSGQQGQAIVIQVQGRNYVEVEDLARIANGTISFNGNQIVLKLPCLGGTNPPSAAPSPPPPPAPGFSKDFLNTGIEAMVRVREWHTALKAAIERGVPIYANWLDDYRTQAQQALRLASAAISTETDKNTYPLLLNEFNNMTNLAAKYVQMTKSMNYFPPDSLQSDSLDQKILACGRTLSAMVTANQIIDDGSCQ
jgi:hypothetical protein